MTTKQNYKVHLYALMKSDKADTLPTPFSVGLKAVFYRHEFRDLSTNATSRKAGWNKKVALQAVRNNDAVPIKPVRPRHHQVGQYGNIMVQSAEALAPELCMLAALFKETQSPEYIKQMQQVLLRAYPDLDHKSPPNHEGLAAFHDKNVPDFNISHAESVVEDVAVLAPSVQFVTAARVMALKTHLAASEEKFEHRHVLPIIASGVVAMEAIELGEETSFNPTLFIEGTKNMVNTFPSSITGKPYFAPEEFDMTLVTSIEYKLRELVEHWDRSRAQVKDDLGNAGLAGIRYEDIRSQVTKAVDASELYPLLTQIVRHSLAKYENILAGGVINPLRQMIEGLAGIAKARNEDDGAAGESTSNKKIKL
ncbi:hypothetical protein CLAIMM_03740 [Cladophialophora immunda]|nr:hypothetical protein CLAIMM_03740 [Cladophialophora immunda]